jgi:hypothetical protein
MYMGGISSRLLSYIHILTSCSHKNLLSNGGFVGKWADKLVTRHVSGSECSFHIILDAHFFKTRIIFHFSEAGTMKVVNKNQL